mmetsp:Transcript_93048/g.249055  ORF Transcript_93048/g.249055 Transcript_93048/m.249055 type:complete len:285 (+) Transcript_93048:362-1216(+)
MALRVSLPPFHPRAGPVPSSGHRGMLRRRPCGSNAAARRIRPGSAALPSHLPRAHLDPGAPANFVAAQEVVHTILPRRRRVLAWSTALPRGFGHRESANFVATQEVVHTQYKNRCGASVRGRRRRPSTPARPGRARQRDFVAAQLAGDPPRLATDAASTQTAAPPGRGRHQHNAPTPWEQRSPQATRRSVAARSVSEAGGAGWRRPRRSSPRLRCASFQWPHPRSRLPSWSLLSCWLSCWLSWSSWSSWWCRRGPRRRCSGSVQCSRSTCLCGWCRRVRVGRGD